MRIQAIKLLEMSNRFYLKKNLLDFGIDYLLMIRRNSNRLHIWFGKVALDNTRHIYGFHYSQDGDKLVKSGHNAFLYSVFSFDETWYGIDKKTYDVNTKCNTLRDLEIILDSIETIKDLTKEIQDGCIFEQ